jgi:hypothetical protein
MFELAPFYKTLFYLAAALLGVEIAFVLSFIQSPKQGWQMYLAITALAASIPLLLGACLASLFGYLKELQMLLISGGLLAAAWFMFSLMSYSLLAGAVFIFVGLISFKMLLYRHTDSKEQS